MNIQIESTLVDTSKEAISQFNDVIEMLIEIKTLKGLKLWAEQEMYNNKHFIFGFGANHCWVKQYYSHGVLCENRLLMITE